VIAACLEGQYRVEFALHGGEVLAIEGRKPNLAKVRFVREVATLNGLKLALDDVRSIGEERHGYFDVALILGIFYHLNVPDVRDYVERISKLGRRMTLIDRSKMDQGILRSEATTGKVLRDGVPCESG
jgi:hypothetical protein